MLETKSEKVGTEKACVHEIACGNVRAAIWRHATEFGPEHTVTVERMRPFGVDEDVRFEREDLLLLSRILDDAHTWILRANLTPGGGASSYHA